MIKGLLGKKLGMTQVFDENGTVTPVTVIEAGPCVVTQVKSQEKDGYDAVQLSFGIKKHPTKPQTGHFSKAGAAVGRYVREIRQDEPVTQELGGKVDATVFEAGEVIDIIGVTKGKGFAGSIRRWGFHRGPMTHGSKYHRGPGSLGARASGGGGRVHKGRKLPGHLGHANMTQLNLMVVRVDSDRNLILVKGAVPGPRGSFVTLRSAVRKRRNAK